MATALDLNRIISVTINLSPTAATYRNFGELMILGSSPVIDVLERQRSYSGIDGVTEDFGTATPEYLAAALFFSQSPQPANIYIGRWAQYATPGLLRGGVLPPAQQLLLNFTTVTNGGFTVVVDGTTRTVTSLNFSGALSLNNVASIVQAALVAAGAVGAQFTWNNVEGQFTLVSGTTGPSSSVGYGATPATGTVDVTGLLALTYAAGADAVVGLAPETLLSCVALLADQFSQWYGLTVATATPPADSDHIAVAGFIEASSRTRIYGVTTQEVTVLDPTRSDDVCSQLMALNYKRTFSQYSSSSPYAVASMYGRAFTVNFDGDNTTITLKFKQEPGVTAEYLTETQANALEAKNCNVFVYYDDDTAIIEQGVMANGYFFDEVHGTDWFQNRCQIDAYNPLYQSSTKVPQTDAGVHELVTALTGSCEAAISNGLAAPGQWNADGFGSLNQGDTLGLGYYIFAPLVRTQSQALRETRVAPPITIALKLAGAIHAANVAVQVNR